MSTSVPAMSGGAPEVVRARDAIKADLELISKRVKESRVRIRDNLDGHRPMSTRDFDVLMESIHKDVAQMDKLLAELFSQMAWENPELLAQP